MHPGLRKQEVSGDPDFIGGSKVHAAIDDQGRHRPLERLLQLFAAPTASRDDLVKEHDQRGHNDRRQQATLRILHRRATRRGERDDGQQFIASETRRNAPAHDAHRNDQHEEQNDDANDHFYQKRRRQIAEHHATDIERNDGRVLHVSHHPLSV